MSSQSYGLQSIEGPFVEETWEFESADLRWLLGYWNDKRGDRACPAWRDIDLPAIYKYAPKIAVKDAIDGGKDFRIRFWGTEITEWLRFDATGKRHSEYFPEASRAQTLEAHHQALFSDIPIRRWGISVYPERDYVAFETIDLPLTDDDGNRAHIISMSHYRIIQRRFDEPPR